MDAILYMNGNAIPVWVEEIESSLEGKRITVKVVDFLANDQRKHFENEMRAKYGKQPLAFHSNFKTLNSKDIKEVIFNGPATIIKWEDGTKTVVKCQPDDMDNFDYETGIALAIMKKVLGNKGNFNTVMKKLIDNARYE